MQQILTLIAPDSVEVPITIDRRDKNTAAVLCLHGFTSSITGHIWFNAAGKFPGQGFDTWRLPFYPGWKGRSMRTISWAQNITDIRLALDEMHKRYAKVFIMAHSLGGSLAVEAADATVSGMVLIDPPHRKDLREETAEDLHPDFYTLDWGELHLCPKSYGDEIVEHCKYESVAKLPCPTLLIRSSSSTDSWPEHLRCKIKVVKNSDHSFAKIGNEKAVFGHTLRFMRAQLSDTQG
jgi:predicted alpha/beta hydrolase family esterase